MSTGNEFEGPDKSAARPPGAHTLFSRRSLILVLIVTVAAIGTIALFYVFRHSGSSSPNAVQLTLGLPHGIPYGPRKRTRRNPQITLIRV
jgi:hypothetical protein